MKKPLPAYRREGVFCMVLSDEERGAGYFREPISQFSSESTPAFSALAWL